ncbi:MAG: hypothetical protein KAR47_13290, partial [Planctomycetes bacterium]|nr:hypothetical protein [Planctomycetota bacterium]
HYPDYGMKFDLNEQIAASGYFAADHKGRTIAGTDRPWLFTSGCLGMTKCLVALEAEGAPAHKYTVRMGFMPRPGDRPGQRVFDIMIQNRLVAGNFDPYKDAGGPDRAVVKEFSGISATDALKIELLARSSTSADNASLINFIEVVKEYDGK